MLSTIIEKLSASYPTQEGCSFSIKEISYEHVTKEINFGEKRPGTFAFVCYKVRVLFEGNELAVLERYKKSLIGLFIESMEMQDAAKVDRDYGGNAYMPSHEGGKYKISCNLTIIG